MLLKSRELLEKINFASKIVQNPHIRYFLKKKSCIQDITNR